MSTPNKDQSSIDESRTIQRAQNGDESAWTHLVSLHQEPIFRLAYLLTSDPHEAEDIAQETFIRAYRTISRFDASRPLRPWLFRISTNLAHNRHRSIRRYMHALSQLTQTQRAVEPATETKHSIRWESQALYEAIQRLRFQDQQVIYLRFFLEMSVEETAEIVEVASGTIKSRLNRAINRLRKVIEADFQDLKEELDGR